MTSPTKGMTRRQILVTARTEDGIGSVQVTAWVKGHLAIHEQLGRHDWQPKQYTLTHVPSGYAIRHSYETLSEARAALDAVSHLDWSEKKSAKETLREGGPGWG